MNVILSLKPEYAAKILSGEKEYEYRKVPFKQRVDKIFMYASSPVCKIVGEFKIDHIIVSEPAKLWKQTNKTSGVAESFFFQYFKNKSLGYGIKIKDLVVYSSPISPSTIKKDFRPPQSFMYVE